jgi:hypothetical protein
MIITNYGIVPATIFNFLSAHAQLFMTLIFMGILYKDIRYSSHYIAKLYIVKFGIDSAFIFLFDITA